MGSSDSDGDTDWNKQFLTEVSKKRGKGAEITEQSRCEQMQECLDQGADVDAVGRNGNTALHMAVKKGYQEVVRFLRHNRARTDIFNQKKYTAITLAEHLNEEEIVSILKEPSKRRSEFTPVDHARPSTSREGQDLSPERIVVHEKGPVAKRRLDADNEREEGAKKQRLEPDKPSQLQRQHDPTVGSASGGSTSSGDPRPGSSTERTDLQPAPFDGRGTYAASGLKRSLHGVVYQWKHLMLILHRAWEQRYSFRLDTELDAAEKFDDVVLEYEDSSGSTVHRFVQLKHKQDETDCKMVSATHLLDVKDGDFSMLKYFTSWRKIKGNADFSRSKSKKFILCTNRGLDLEKLKANGIDVNEVQVSDKFLEVTIETKQQPRFYELVDKPSKLHDTLKFASDVHSLARELAERVCGSNKNLHLNTKIMKRYHAALAAEVVDVKSQKFFPSFISDNDLSTKAQEFREIFFIHARKYFPQNAPDIDVWKGLEAYKLNLPESFGAKFKLDKPELISVGQFSDEFVKLVNNSWSNKVVKINRRVYNTRSRDASKKLVADNVDKLAGYVLITENKKPSKKLKFSSQFMNETSQLLGDMEAFRDTLKTRLGSRFAELDEFEIEINNFKTCTEEELSSTTELPDDEIDDGEIAEFLKQFILAVNQPNEEELGEMIKLEIGAYSQFNLLNVDFIGDSFESKIVKWLKKTGKHSKFLDNEDAAAFFYGIERELSSLITVGLNLPYTAKLKKYDIKFKREIGDLTNFLGASDPNKPILELMSSKSTLLTALRVYQTLEQLEEYKKNDSLIFIHLEKLLLIPDIMNQVLRAFESSHSHDLLVIDCEAIGVNLNTWFLWDPLLNIVADNREKRMILIIGGNQDSVVRFQNASITWTEMDDDVSFDNLKDCSRDKLKKKTVVRLQKHEEKTSFGRLLPTQLFDDIGAEPSTAFGKIIDANTLVRLIQDKEIRIDTEVEGLSEVKDYYVSRTIVSQVVIKKDILKAKGIKDVFALSGIERQTLELLVANGESQTEIRLNECVFLDNSREPDDFKVLCEQNPGRNIHRLQASSGRLIWKQTVGDVASLRAYKEASDDIVGSGAIHLAKDKLVDLTEEQQKIVILSDRAGMGKTTVLTYLAGEMKPSKPGLLVIMIELIRHTVALAKEKETRTFDGNDTGGAVDFLVDKLLSLDTDMEREAFKAIIRVTGNAALLFDGFDEISPTYENAVIDLLQALKKLPIKKLYVTTRPHTSGALEEKLGTFSYTLLPFSEENQVKFLTKFWERKLGSNDVDEATTKDLRKHAIAVLRILVKSINRQMQEFAGVPLQTRLVAEAFPYEEKGNRHKLPKSINLTGLYKRFVDKKYLIFCKEKKLADGTNPAQSDEDDAMREILSIKHEKLALEALFDAETVRALLGCQPEGDRMCSLFKNINDWIKRIGIVTPVISGKPHFVHRTFAEYFAATFIIKTLKVENQNQETRKFFMKDLFVKPEHSTVRAFLNCSLSGGDYALGNKSWEFSLSEYCDAESRTLYHIAAFEGHIEIVRFFINHLSKQVNISLPQEETSEETAVINLRDKFGSTALAITMDKLYNSDVVKCFVEGGAKVNCKCAFGKTPLHIVATKPENFDLVQYVVEKRANVNSSAQNGETPLHNAVSVRGNFKTVKYLVKKGADVHFLDNNDETPLYNAVRCVGNWAVVKHLVENGADVDCQNSSGYTPLHFSTDNIGNLDVAKYLIDSGATINCEQKTGMTALHYSTRVPRQLDMVGLLVEKGANVNSPTKSGDTPLHIAVIHPRNIEVVSYLVGEGADVNFQRETGMKTPLHSAVIHAGDLEIVEYLFAEGADVNCKDNDGYTPLYYAVFQAKHLDLVKFLIENCGAQVNVQGEHRNTPLHNAATTAHNFDTVKYLVEKDANVNAEGEHRRTPLHNAAATPCNFDIVEFLIDNDADIHSEEKSGLTPLYYAAGVKDNLDVVKHLIDRGASVNSQRDRCDTPLHSATLTDDNFNTVKYLIDEGADVNFQNELGKTPLHNAALVKSNLKVVKYLTDNGANIDSLDDCSKTPLHNAVTLAENFDTVKHLIDEGANVHSRDVEGFTPFHYAAGVLENLDVLQYLFEKRVDVNSRGALGNTPLHIAARADYNLDVVEYLTKNGADVNSRGEHGRTPLHNAAIATDNFYVVKHLVDKGADIHSRDADGFTPLYYAAGVFDNLRGLQCLIGKGAVADSRGLNGDTPLHNAASTSHSVNSVKYLIENGANIKSVGEHGRTPLHCAALEAYNFDVVEYLVEKGADPHVRDSNGKTPFDYATFHVDNNANVIKYLIKKGSNNDSLSARSSETESID